MLTLSIRRRRGWWWRWWGGECLPRPLDSLASLLYFNVVTKGHHLSILLSSGTSPWAKVFFLLCFAVDSHVHLALANKCSCAHKPSSQARQSSGTKPSLRRFDNFSYPMTFSSEPLGNAHFQFHSTRTECEAEILSVNSKTDQIAPQHLLFSISVCTVCSISCQSVAMDTSTSSTTSSSLCFRPTDGQTDGQADPLAGFTE